MPTIEVPLKPYTAYPSLKSSKKFKRLADEATRLAKQAKFIEARRSELSLELYELLDDALDEQTKSIAYPVACMNEDCPQAREGDHTHDATFTKKRGGPNVRFSKELAFEYPIACANPKCKTVNHFTAEAYKACQKRGDDRRDGVSIKLPGDVEDE